MDHLHCPTNHWRSHLKSPLFQLVFIDAMIITFNTCVKNTPLCGKTLLKSEIIVLQLSHLIFGVKYLLDNLQLAPF